MGRTDDQAERFGSATLAVQASFRMTEITRRLASRRISVVDTRQGVPRDIDGVLRSQIVYYAIATLKALNDFARGLQGALHA